MALVFHPEASRAQVEIYWLAGLAAQQALRGLQWLGNLLRIELDCLHEPKRPMYQTIARGRDMHTQ